jgi:K+-sensing histidine kinase KdpD
MERARAFARMRNVSLEPPARAPGVIMGERDLLVRAIHALLETAVKFSAERTSVRISCEADLEALRLTLDSHGRSIPESALERFFDVFSIGDALTPGGDLGLGPPLACRILSLFGASVTVVNREPSAVRLAISFREAETPAAPHAAAEACAVSR